MTESLACTILEVTIEASKKELTKAYRACILKYHPDKNKHYNSHSEFIQIQEAYDFLMQKIDFRSTEKEVLIKRYTRQANADKAYKDKLKEKINERKAQNKANVFENIKQLIHLNIKK